MINTLLTGIGIFILFTAILCAFILLKFNSSDLSRFDLPKHANLGTRSEPSPEHIEMVQLIHSGMAEQQTLNRAQQLLTMRQQLDERGEAFDISAEIIPVDVVGMKAEWVIAPKTNLNRRLLYIHGGGYMIGSPKSHRLITSKLSSVANAAVLAIDFRQMPEHSRMDGIQDCRNAYSWILENGPSGSQNIETLIVAGDSSGGNLALSTIAWARDQRIQAADAVIAFSPQTDLTLSSPSLVSNIDTDVMQGASFGPIVKAPKVIALGFSFLMHKTNPSDPIVSPLLGDLSNLPPTLIQASEAEMFLDDAVRYVNKANMHGSTAILQTWPFIMHVWQAFEMPESDEAYVEIKKFLDLHT